MATFTFLKENNRLIAMATATPKPSPKTAYAYNEFKKIKRSANPKLIIVEFVDESYEIYPERDKVTIGEDVYLPESKTAAEMFELLNSSEVFLEANGDGVSGPVSASDVTETTSRKFVTSTQKTKIDNLDASLTTAENNAKTYADGLVTSLWNDRGNYDASVNTFPAAGGSGASGAIKKGDIWTVSVPGVLGGQEVVAGDTVRALLNAPGQTAGNWNIQEGNLGYVPLRADAVTSDPELTDDESVPNSAAVKEYVAANSATEKPYIQLLTAIWDMSASDFVGRILSGNETLIIENAPTYFIGIIVVTGNGYIYTVNGSPVVLNATGETLISIVKVDSTYIVTSDGAVADPDELPPVIEEHPASQEVEEGEDIVLTVDADDVVGADNITYQWYKDSVLISGATASTLTIPASELADSGDYHCRVTDPDNDQFVDTDIATVTVTEAPELPVALTPLLPLPGSVINTGGIYSGGGGVEMPVQEKLLAGEEGFILIDINNTEFMLNHFGFKKMADPSQKFFFVQNGAFQLPFFDENGEIAVNGIDYGTVAKVGLNKTIALGVMYITFVGSEDGITVIDVGTPHSFGPDADIEPYIVMREGTNLRHPVGLGLIIP